MPRMRNLVSLFWHHQIKMTSTFTMGRNTRRQVEDNDVGALTPIQRPGSGSKSASPGHQMSRDASGYKRTGPTHRRAAGLTREDDSDASKPGQPSLRSLGLSEPGVFKPTDISSSNTSGRGNSQNSLSQPQKELATFVKTAVFKSGIATYPQSDCDLPKPHVPSKSVIHLTEKPRTPMVDRSLRPISAKKGSIGVAQQPPPQRKARAFENHANKGDSAPKKAAPKTLQPSSSSERQEEDALKGHMSNASIIDDPSKLETRWNRAKLLVQHALKPYRKVLVENDDLLPDLEELDADDESTDDDDDIVEEIREQMLDDGQLTEREIAAFFLGFSIFNVKVKSLQSQLKSAKSKHVVTSTVGSNAKGSDLVDSGEKQASVPLPPKGISCKSMSILRIQQDPKTSPENQRLLKELEEAEKKQKKLEKQIKQAGLQIAEEIPYEEAKAKVAKIAERMQEIGSSEVTHPDKQTQAKLREEYYKLEQDMERFSTALVLTDEYIAKQEEKETIWEKENESSNMEALKKLRRHMPVAVKSMSEAQLCSQPTPNGKVLPMVIARKFKRTNVLQLLRTSPEDITRMHPSTLEQMRVVGMTLTERRAMHAHLKDVGPRWKAMLADSVTERKWAWYNMMRTTFKETLAKFDYHVEQYGPPGSHPYATRANPKGGCPMIGKQCPLRADQMPSYDDNYGFTEEAEYEVTDLRKADAEDLGVKAASDATTLVREKRTIERLDALRRHYKGVLQVTLANGSTLR